MAKAKAAVSTPDVKIVPRHQRMAYRKAIRRGQVKLRLIGTAATGYTLAAQRPNGSFVKLFGAETTFAKQATAVSFGERKCGMKAQKVVGS